MASSAIPPFVGITADCVSLPESVTFSNPHAHGTIHAVSIFSALLDFIQHRMRMSHIYQPVMLDVDQQQKVRAHFRYPRIHFNVRFRGNAIMLKSSWESD